MTQHEASSFPNQPLETHKLVFTVFPDNAARSKTRNAMTLPDLALLMAGTVAVRKDKLPLLKLADFGEEKTPKNCLRSNANMGLLHGIEVEHDEGIISYKQAVKTLRTAGLRCLVYTTPSHMPIERERWRALLPITTGCDKQHRAAYVARVNGLFGGRLAPESFALSQAFYYGSIKGQDATHITVLDGDCIDQRRDIAEMFPQTKVVALNPKAGAATYSIADLDAMLVAYERSGEGWHNSMVAITASLVSRGWSDGDIGKKCGPFCWLGPEDPDLVELVRSARTKFGRKPPPAGLAAVLGVPVAGARTPDNPPDIRTAPGKPPAPIPPGVSVPQVEPPKPAHDAPFNDKVSWLLESYAFEPNENRVVRLYGTSSRCRVLMPAFQQDYMAWRHVQVGPRGGSQIVQATAGWSISEHRVSLAGVRMAPGQPFPLFEENGSFFKNTYLQPQYAENPDPEAVVPFLDFLGRLVPDEAQRNYKLDWMAHKLREPETPGCAIMHLADNDLELEGAREGSFGTGRGILFSIARALYGVNYTSEQDFRMLDGSSAQSIYTDWLHDNLLVTVDESPSSPTSYRAGERALAYETLKRVIDPAPTQRTFVGKYQQAFTGMCHCSIWIASNHHDALAIPAGDRRITVLRNGSPMTHDEIDKIVAWRSKPGSLAALAGHLAARDLSGFNMHRPLATAAKAAMVDANRNEAEQVMVDIGADDERGMVFTRADLYAAVSAQLNRGELISGHFEHAWRRWITKAMTRDGSQRRTRSGGTIKRLFCFRRMAAEVKLLSEEDAHAEAKRWSPGLLW